MQNYKFSRHQNDPGGASPFAHLLCFPCIPWNCSLWSFHKETSYHAYHKSGLYLSSCFSSRRIAVIKNIFFSYYSTAAFAALPRQGFTMVCLCWVVALNNCTKQFQFFWTCYIFLHFANTLEEKKKKERKNRARALLKPLGCWAAPGALGPWNLCDCLCPPINASPIVPFCWGQGLSDETSLATQI